MICVPIRQKNAQKVLIRVKAAQKIADMVEVWLDDITDLNEQNLGKIFKFKKKPFLYKSSGNVDKLTTILNYKPEYIDLDFSTKPKIIQSVRDLSPKTKIILSFHDFQQTPSLKKLKQIIKKMQRKNADIFKIAAQANSFVDSLNMLAFLEEMNLKDQKSIFISMGKAGLITRTAGHLFGNYLMYAPLNAKEFTAPGQISAKELKKLINQ